MKSRWLPLTLPLLLSTHLAVAAGFDQTLGLQGIQFRVICANQGSFNTLRILPSGLLKTPSMIEQEISGTVTGAEIADLNADGWPEIYVYVHTAGDGGYGTVVAHAVNRGKSVTPIYFPELADKPVIPSGYAGEAFAVIESTLAQRFPIYKEGDANGEPTGGWWQFQYRLKAGEAGWVLRPDKKSLSIRP